MLLFEGTFTLFFNDKKESQKSSIQGFSYYFCMMKEGSGSDPGGQKTRGSGTLAHIVHFSIYKKEKNPKRDHCGRPNTATSSLFDQK